MAIFASLIDPKTAQSHRRFLPKKGAGTHTAALKLKPLQRETNQTEHLFNRLKSMERIKSRPDKLKPAGETMGADCIEDKRPAPDKDASRRHGSWDGHSDIDGGWGKGLGCTGIMSFFSTSVLHTEQDDVAPYMAPLTDLLLAVDH